jgi:hypothetical protein
LICDGLSAYKKTILLPLNGNVDLSLIYDSILLDNPIFYFAPSFRFIKDVSKQQIQLMPTYGYSPKAIKQYADTMRSYLSKFDWLKNKSDVEKELYVHDYCLANFTYDYTFSTHSFSPIGLLSHQTGVCSGISKFVKILLDYLGAECMLVSGEAIRMDRQKPESHMWNIVDISGSTYHLDVTFDLSLTTNTNRYDYFNLSDAEIKRDHSITPIMPRCSVFGKDYYTANSLVAHDLKELGAIIKKNIKKKKNPVVVKLNDSNLIRDDNMVDKVTKIALKQCGIPFFGSVSLEVSFNPSQHIFELAFK